jgi:hypothetical protein
MNYLTEAELNSCNKKQLVEKATQGELRHIFYGTYPRRMHKEDLVKGLLAAQEKHQELNDPEKQQQSRVKYLRVELERAVRKAKEAREELASRILKEGAYALSWAQGSATAMAYGEYAQEVLDRNDASLEQAIRDQVERLTNSLLRNEFSSNSTSLYSNAVRAERGQAASQFVNTFTTVGK